MFWSRTSIRWGDNKGWPCGWNRGEVNPIDFTPLYDWIDHDGGECPVNPDATIDTEYKNDFQVVTDKASAFIWVDVARFRLSSKEKEANGTAYKHISKSALSIGSDCPEQRSDAIDIPPPEHDPRDVAFRSETPEATHATAHHKRPDGTDLIDDWWNDYTPETARILMWEQVKKYYGRLGKKDPIHIEVSKMADYLARWDKKERELAGVDDKPNTIV